MIIGIDGSRAFLKQRTGIEEYSYQVIKNLRDKLKEEEIILYLKKKQKVDFELPKNWKIKEIKISRFWTQIGLSLELFFYPIDVLFVPSHVLPLYHPKKSIITIHGLEFEIMPEAYPFLGRVYMHFSIKKSCFLASKVIAVSKNTKKDLMELYNVPEEKIEVIYEGVVENFKLPISNFQSNLNEKILKYKPYLLFIGRLEKRKNIEGIIEAYKILKEKYAIPHDLVLVGFSGFGYEDIKSKIEEYSKIKNLELKIIELGYVEENEKRALISKADVFLFPTFYEGFGLPILEAQTLGTPVVASNTSSLPEVGGEGVAYCDPQEPRSIADASYKIINDEYFRNNIINKGHENVKNFSWDKCASLTVQILK